MKSKELVDIAWYGIETINIWEDFSDAENDVYIIHSKIINEYGEVNKETIKKYFELNGGTVI